MGPEGTGQIGIQQMLGKIDLVMGAFSKSFASNGGFVAANSESVTRYIGAYASSWAFSTALSPIETSVAREALRIIRSGEGDNLRGALRRNAQAVRETLVERDLRCYGEPSSLVPVAVGSERTARIASGLLDRRGLAVNLVEFPAVPLGGARFRMQTMSTHSVAQAQQAGTTMADVLAEAESIIDGVGPSTTNPR
jgi:7-keto-8-aminopelargonate synthetase-like enzyme